MNAPALTFDHIHLISKDPQAAASWYVNVLGAEIADSQTVRNALQITVSLSGAHLLIRGQRAGEQPAEPASLEQFVDFISHNQWGTDHFGFLVHGDLRAFCQELRAKGARFSVQPHEFAPGVHIAYLEAPDGVSVELVQA